jgi:hypothetical protein
MQRASRRAIGSRNSWLSRVTAFGAKLLRHGPDEANRGRSRAKLAKQRDLIPVLVNDDHLPSWIHRDDAAAADIEGSARRRKIKQRSAVSACGTPLDHDAVFGEGNGPILDVEVGHRSHVHLRQRT